LQISNGTWASASTPRHVAALQLLGPQIEPPHQNAIIIFALHKCGLFREILNGFRGPSLIGDVLWPRHPQHPG
jgi:hypothetical protein